MNDAWSWASVLASWKPALYVPAVTLAVQQKRPTTVFFDEGRPGGRGWPIGSLRFIEPASPEGSRDPTFFGRSNENWEPLTFSCRQ
jgi:hypothetical protein